MRILLISLFLVISCTSNQKGSNDFFREKLDAEAKAKRLSKDQLDKRVNIEITLSSYFQKQILIDVDSIQYSFDGEVFQYKYDLFADNNSRYFKLDPIVYGAGPHISYIIFSIDTEGEKPKNIYLKFKDSNQIKHTLKSKISYKMYK